MLIGDSAYEVVPGFLGTPIGSFDQYRAEYYELDPGLSTDEELLGQYLVPHLG